MSVEFWESGDGWRWRVRARNGRLIATSGEAFHTKSNATRSWSRFAQLMAAPKGSS